MNGLPKKQCGIALLILMGLLGSAFLAVAVQSQGRQSDRDKIASAALAQARDALIGYAITYGDTHASQVHGYLPCPDLAGGNAEGIAELVCGNQNVSSIGRLPWLTLDLPPPKGGECLWYAVSGTYKNNPKTGLMNWDTNGQLRVYSSDGATLLTPADNQAVAVVIWPGSAASGQNRSGSTAPVCGGNYTQANYLQGADAFNGTSAYGLSQFRMNSAKNAERMIFITREDIWHAMQKRNDFLSTLDTLTRKVAECIAGYGYRNNAASNKSLPWAAPLQLADYAVNTDYDDTGNLSSGRPPFRVNTSRSQSSNAIAGPYYLLQDDVPAGSANCPTGWSAYYSWWDNWKDHLFYALAQRFEPSQNATQPCGTCLSVNGSGKYAAVVLFANQRLPGQIRAGSTTDAQRGVAANYLEGLNASHIAHASGNENYQAQTAGASFNDTLYCINESLTVVKGDSSATPACPP